MTNGPERQSKERMTNDEARNTQALTPAFSRIIALFSCPHRLLVESFVIWASSFFRHSFVIRHCWLRFFLTPTLPFARLLSPQCQHVLGHLQIAREGDF